MILYALYNVLVHAATHHGVGVVRANRHRQEGWRRRKENGTRIISSV